MKRTYVIFIIIATTLLSFILIAKPVYADTDGKAINVDDMFAEADEFIKKGKDSNDSSYNDDIKNTFVPIAQILVNIGGGVIAVVTAIMAIKYMLANAEGKAKLKTQLIGLAIATFVIFGAQFIWSTLYETLNNI